MFAFGHGVAESYDQVVFWFKKAAEQGHASAKVKLRELLTD